MATGTVNLQTLALPLRYRRNVATLNAGQLKLLRDAFRKVQAFSDADDRGYQHWSGIHGLPLPAYCDIAHGTPLFLPWHRAYLYRFERALRDQVPDAMLAWWDWRTPANQQGQIPAALADQNAGSQPNPLFNAKVQSLAIQQGGSLGQQLGTPTRRAPSTSRRLPTPQQIETLLDEDDFTTFSEQLDNFHGGVHMWVGAHMSRIPFSAYDPIFYFHHTMIDRVWRIWQLRHGRAGPPESLWDEPLDPFNMTVRRTLSVTRLGYDYAARTVSRPVTV